MQVRVPKGVAITTCLNCGMYLGHMKESDNLVHLNKKLEYTYQAHAPNPQDKRLWHDRVPNSEPPPKTA